MHGRIIQLMDKRNEDRIGEDALYDYVPSKFDYVDTITGKDASESIKCCFDRPGLSYDTRKRTLTIVSKEQYFEEKYENFKSELAKVQDMDFETFCNRGHWILINLTDAYSDEAGTWIYKDGELETLDDFIRYRDDEDSYYVGSVFDYHI